MKLYILFYSVQFTIDVLIGLNSNLSTTLFFFFSLFPSFCATNRALILYKIYIIQYMIILVHIIVMYVEHKSFSASFFFLSEFIIIINIIISISFVVVEFFSLLLICLSGFTQTKSNASCLYQTNRPTTTIAVAMLSDEMYTCTCIYI